MNWKFIREIDEEVPLLIGLGAQEEACLLCGEPTPIPLEVTGAEAVICLGCANGHPLDYVEGVFVGYQGGFNPDTERIFERGKVIGYRQAEKARDRKELRNNKMWIAAWVSLAALMVCAFFASVMLRL